MCPTRRRRATTPRAVTWSKPRRPPASCPGILVVHENRGLNPHIEDIARRLALENFSCSRPTHCAPLGGYPGDEDKAREPSGGWSSQDARGHHRSVAYLKGHPGGTGKVGAVGFCYGGGITNILATRLPDSRGGRAVLRHRARRRAPRPSRRRCCSSRRQRRTHEQGVAAYEAALKAASKYTAHAIRAPSTASTTTPHRASTPPRPSRRGSGPSPSSTGGCAANASRGPARGRESESRSESRARARAARNRMATARAAVSAGRDAGP